MAPKRNLSQWLFSTAYPIALKSLSIFLVIIFVCLIAIGLTLAVVHYYPYRPSAKVIYTGKLNGEFTGDAVMLDCRSSSSYFVLFISEVGYELTDSHVNISLPTTELSTGNHLLSGNFQSDSEYGVVGTIFDSDQWCFSEGNFISGSVTLKNVPDRPRKRIQGTFEAIFRCENDRIELKGEFSFRTKDDFNADCLN